MSGLCPKSEIASSHETFLDSVWTNPGFPCPISVQEPLNWTGTLQTFDNFGQGLDRPCTFLLVRQTLDRVWTEIGLKLDFVSSATNHRQGAPNPDGAKRVLNTVTDRKRSYTYQCPYNSYSSQAVKNSETFLSLLYRRRGKLVDLVLRG